MKSFRLSTSVTIQEYKDFRLRGKTSLSSYKSYTLLAKFKAGGLTDFRLKAGVYDSSNMRFLPIEATKRKVERFVLAGKISETNSLKYFTIASRIKINNFEASTLISRIGISKVSSFKLEVRVHKANFSWRRLKSLTRKKGYSSHTLDSSVIKIGRKYATYFMLKNSTGVFSLSENITRDFDGVTSQWARFTVTSESIPAIRSVIISFCVEELSMLSPLQSDTYSFSKAPLRDFTGLRAFASTSVVSMKRDFDGVSSPYIHLIGTFATLSPVRSNPIFFSVSREIVDFQLNDTTALSLNLIMTKLDTRVPKTQMHVDFGKNLFKVSFSRFRRIIDPFVDKEEDKSFYCGAYHQGFLLDYKPNKYHLDDLSISKINPEVDSANLPFKIKGRSVPEIFFKERSAYKVRVKKETEYVKFISSSAETTLGKIDRLNSFLIRYDSNRIGFSVGSSSSKTYGEGIKTRNLTKIASQSFVILTGLHATVTYPPGETVRIETVKEDSNGVPVGVEYKDYTRFNGSNQIFNFATFETSRERFNGDGLSCKIPFSVEIPLDRVFHFSQRLHIVSSFTILNLDGLLSPKQSFRAVFTTDIPGSISEKNRFTANIFEQLSPLRYKINLRTAV